MKAKNIDNIIWVKCTTTQFFLFLFLKCIGPSGFVFLIILFIFGCAGKAQHIAAQAFPQLP